MRVLLLLNLITPFVMIFTAKYLKKHTGANIDSQNRYNTLVVWKFKTYLDYEQSIAPDSFILSGNKLLVAQIVFSVLFYSQI